MRKAQKRLRDFIKTHKKPVIIVGAIIVLVVAGIITGAVVYNNQAEANRQAMEQREQEEKEADDARVKAEEEALAEQARVQAEIEALETERVEPVVSQVENVIIPDQQSEREDQESRQIYYKICEDINNNINKIKQDGGDPRGIYSHPHNKLLISFYNQCVEAGLTESIF